MRHIKQPVRFSDPVYIMSACKKKQQPFEGQPRKRRQARRYPEIIAQQSRIPYAGFGLFVAEDVKAGQPITTYKRKIISEREAKKLKEKVWIMYFRNSNTVENDVLTEQGNRHVRANNAACCCLNSKHTSSADLDSLRSTHDVAGFANSSEKSNAIFVDFGYNTVLEAKVDLVRGTEVLAKYSLV
jgi:hypothetical protein